MKNKDINIEYKKIFELNDKNEKKEIILEHYKRCKEYCLSYNNTIWSMPSIAIAINVGTYYAMFDDNKAIQNEIVLISLIILIILNISLTLGIFKHYHFQQNFGKRILEIEKCNNIPYLDFNEKGLYKLRTGKFYIVSMLLITIISITVLICKLFN